MKLLYSMLENDSNHVLRILLYFIDHKIPLDDKLVIDISNQFIEVKKDFAKECETNLEFRLICKKYCSNKKFMIEFLPLIQDDLKKEME